MLAFGAFMFGATITGAASPVLLPFGADSPLPLPKRATAARLRAQTDVPTCWDEYIECMMPKYGHVCPLLMTKVKQEDTAEARAACVANRQCKDFLACYDRHTNVRRRESGSSSSSSNSDDDDDGRGREQLQTEWTEDDFAWGFAWEPTLGPAQDPTYEPAQEPTTGASVRRRFWPNFPIRDGVYPHLCWFEMIDCGRDQPCQKLFAAWKADETDANAAACRENHNCHNYMYCYQWYRPEPFKLPERFDEEEKTSGEIVEETGSQRGGESNEEVEEMEAPLEDENCDGGEVEACWLDPECQQNLEGFADGLEPECWDNAACAKAFSCYAKQHDCDEPCGDEALACALDEDCSLWVHGVSDDVLETDAAWGDCLEMEKCNALVECAAWDEAKTTSLEPVTGSIEDVVKGMMERAYEEKVKAAVAGILKAHPVWPIKEAMRETLKKATASMLQSCPSCQ